MDIQEIILSQVRGLGEDTHCRPNIPERKLNGAVKGIMGNEDDKDSVIAILDTTVFGGGDNGLAFTDTAFYVKLLMEDRIKIAYADISKAEVHGAVLKDLLISFKNGCAPVKIEAQDFKASVVASILNGIVEARDAEARRAEERRLQLEGNAPVKEVKPLGRHEYAAVISKLQTHGTILLILGIVLTCCTLFWWGIAAIIIGIELLSGRGRDNDLCDCGFPLSVYEKDVNDIIFQAWFGTAILLGVFGVPVCLKRSRERMRALKSVLHNLHALSEDRVITLYRQAFGEKNDSLARAFVSDQLEWMDSQGIVTLLDTDAGRIVFEPGSLDELRSRTDSLAAAKGCVSLNEIKNVSSDIVGDLVAEFIGPAVEECGIKGSVYKLTADYYVFSEVTLKTTVDALNARSAVCEPITMEEMTNVVAEATGIKGVDTIAFVDQCGGDFQAYTFESGKLYVGYVNSDHVKVCAGCGVAKWFDKSEEGTPGEYYCSDYCRETDEMMDRLIKDIRTEKFIKAGINGAAYGSVVADIAHHWDYNKGRVASMSGMGHGLAAEDANTLIDRLMGVDAHVSGTDNSLNGPDRIVKSGGIEYSIQSKYCRTAYASVNEAFKKSGKYDYMKDNKPMQLEVPRDQYLQAIEEMKKKIAEGKVPGIKPNETERAKEIVRKGHLTYEQARNLCKPMTIESLTYDAVSGVIMGATSAGISFVLTTALGYWKTKDIKRAMRSAVIVAVETGGKTAVAYVIGAQLQRVHAVKKFLDSAININFHGHGKLVKSLGDGLSKMAKPNAAKYNNKAANSAIKGAVVTAAATFTVTSCWEIGCCCCGRISASQCLKNIVVGGAGIGGGTAGALAGAAWGTTICPGVGTFIGGLIGGFAGGSGATMLAKMGMDSLVDDDSILVMKIVQSQIQIFATLFCLSHEEINRVVGMIEAYVQDQKSFVTDVYSKKKLRRQYLTRIFKPMFVKVVMERPFLLANQMTDASVDSAFSDLA